MIGSERAKPKTEIDLAAQQMRMQGMRSGGGAMVAELGSKRMGWQNNRPKNWVVYRMMM